jgi:hypothetical protein
LPPTTEQPSRTERGKYKVPVGQMTVALVLHLDSHNMVGTDRP